MAHKIQDTAGGGVRKEISPVSCDALPENANSTPILFPDLEVTYELVWDDLEMK